MYNYTVAIVTEDEVQYVYLVKEADTPEAAIRRAMIQYTHSHLASEVIEISANQL